MIPPPLKEYSRVLYYTILYYMGLPLLAQKIFHLGVEMGGGGQVNTFLHLYPVIK